MVICKYYQQGTCRFGNSCRFDHVSNYASGDSGFRGRFGNHQYASNNYYSGNNKQPTTYKAPNSSHHMEDIMKMVVQEVLQSEKGGQWPLSCFAPIKERQCFPGWEDHSPEEIRWMMYEALKNGTLPDCQRQIKDLYDAAKVRVNNILHPNEEVYKIVEKIYSGQKIETESSFSFVQAAAQSNAGTGNKFSLWNTPAFGGNEQQQSSAASSFTFALPQFGGGPVNQPPVQQPSSIFGVTMNPMSTETAQMPGMANVNQMPSMFGGATPVQTPSPFGIVTPQQQQQDFSKFQQSAQPVVQATSTPTGFGVRSTSILNTNSASNFSKSDSSVDNTVYSSKSDLTNDELNIFLEPIFTMGKVPTKPPPKELCTM
ncbi:hypothetical protein C0J52_24870 [Blattella germanica]|nr:hypothetical protein C0J52_24870 [Blattella germanica]